MQDSFDTKIKAINQTQRVNLNKYIVTLMVRPRPFYAVNATEWSIIELNRRLKLSWGRWYHKLIGADGTI